MLLLSLEKTLITFFYNMFHFLFFQHRQRCQKVRNKTISLLLPMPHETFASFISGDWPIAGAENHLIDFHGITEGICLLGNLNYFFSCHFFPVMFSSQVAISFVPTLGCFWIRKLTLQSFGL